MSDNSLSNWIWRLILQAKDMSTAEKMNEADHYFTKYRALSESDEAETAAYSLSVVFADFSGELSCDRASAIECVNVCRQLRDDFPDNEKIAFSLIRTIRSCLYVNCLSHVDEGTRELMLEAFSIAESFPDETDIVFELSECVCRMMFMCNEYLIPKALACDALDRLDPVVRRFPMAKRIQGNYAYILTYGCGFAQNYERGTRLPVYCARLRMLYENLLDMEYRSYVRSDLEWYEKLIRKTAQEDEDRRAGRIHLSLEDLKAQIWNEDPDVVFRGVYADDFDRLEVQLYSGNGKTIIDEFEYIDAGYDNEIVNERRREFLDWQREKSTR